MPAETFHWRSLNWHAIVRIQVRDGAAAAVLGRDDAARPAPVHSSDLTALPMSTAEAAGGDERTARLVGRVVRRAVAVEADDAVGFGDDCNAVAVALDDDARADVVGILWATGPDDRVRARTENEKTPG
ncbi:MAG: hypothetical protein M3N46_09110 [Actinomycetota bacterium]|nr:hypothetical protein [Actinomycetota bacterium]